MIAGQHDLLMQALTYPFENILDIGAGNLAASRIFAESNKRVVATGFDIASYGVEAPPDEISIIQDLDVCHMDRIEDCEFDAIWCAHVLEHVQDTGIALSEMWRVLKPKGHLFISVPEYSPFVVGGHINTGWNLGTLMYVLILNGFDVRNGSFINHCWNITAFVQKSEKPSTTLRHDNGDIERLSKLFPKDISAKQGFLGDLYKANWNWRNADSKESEQRFKQSKRRHQLQSLIPPAIRNVIRAKKLQDKNTR